MPLYVLGNYNVQTSAVLIAQPKHHDLYLSQRIPS